MSFELDPHKTAQENLWEATRMITLAFKAAYCRKGLVLTKDEWNEVIDDVMFWAVKRFMTRVCEGRYDRSVSFFLNVRSCVFSLFHERLNLYIKNVVKRKADSLDRMNPEIAEYIQNTNPMPKYVRGECEKKTAMYDLKNRAVNNQHMSRFVTKAEQELWDYIESCEEMNLPVDRSNLVYLLGAGAALGEKVPGVKMELHRYFIKGNDVHGRLIVNGTKLCDTVESMATLIPFGEYESRVSKYCPLGRHLTLIYNKQVPAYRGTRIVVAGASPVAATSIRVPNRDAENAVTVIAEHGVKLTITHDGLLFS